MVLGFLFILFGVLIVRFPELLSYIVAFFLISIGISLVSMHYHYRRISRRSDNPFVNFIIRF